MPIFDVDKIKKETGEIRREVRERTAGYLIGALGLIVGLAWNEAVKALIEYWFPFSANTILAKFLYAAGMTVVIAIMAYYFMGKNGKEKRDL